MSAVEKMMKFYNNAPFIAFLIFMEQFFSFIIGMLVTIKFFDIQKPGFWDILINGNLTMSIVFIVLYILYKIYWFPLALAKMWDRKREADETQPK